MEQNFGFNSVNQVKVYFEKGREIPVQLEEFLSNLHQHAEKLFSYPIRNAINAVNSLNTTKPHLSGSHYGGATMAGNEIKVSARTVLDLLAGRLTYDDFPDSYKAYFKGSVEEGRLFEAAKIEKDPTEQDDDWLVFRFGEPDPAVTPYRIP